MPFDKDPFIIARGLCERTKFDTHFQVLNDEQGYVMYQGKHLQIFTGPLVFKAIVINN